MNPAMLTLLVICLAASASAYDRIFLRIERGNTVTEYTAAKSGEIYTYEFSANGKPKTVYKMQQRDFQFLEKQSEKLKNVPSDKKSCDRSNLQVELTSEKNTVKKFGCFHSKSRASKGLETLHRSFKAVTALSR